MYDVIILGGGPAGLSAALVLGRCRRRVLVCEDDRHRNDASLAVHGFLTRDGIHPAELRRLGREQLDPYGVEYRIATVTAAERTEAGFRITLADAPDCLETRILLLATGVIDHVPDTPGFHEFYGRGVFHCPYCDGWEVRDLPLAAYGSGRNVAGLALSLKTWSDDVAVCTGGAPAPPRPEAAQLARHGIAVYRQKITRLEGTADRLERIVFGDGTAIERRAIFLSTGQEQRCNLAASLGCRFTRKGAVQTGRLEETGIPGLWVAGDASKDVQLAIVAAAEGAKAAFAINTTLEKQERR